jgi:hypothetical protein
MDRRVGVITYGVSFTEQAILSVVDKSTGPIKKVNAACAIYSRPRELS